MILNFQFFGSIIDHIIEVQTDTGESSSSSTLELSWYGAVGGMTHGVTHKSSYKSAPPAAPAMICKSMPCSVI